METIIENEWKDISDIPKFLGDTIEERIERYIAYKNAGLTIVNIK